jgi:hypothetical protein
MKPGDIVKRKSEDEYGVVTYSSFGISIHQAVEHEGQLGLSKTLGDRPSAYEKYWEVVNKLPNGWKIGKFGCPIKE